MIDVSGQHSTLEREWAAVGRDLNAHLGREVR
jgi:hypothetical protein